MRRFLIPASVGAILGAGVPASAQDHADLSALAASIGKTFLAATVLTLENEGRLSRTDLLPDHLGDHQWSSTLPSAGTMTIGQLLQHSPGLPDHVYLPAFRAAWAEITNGKGAVLPGLAAGYVAPDAPSGLAPSVEQALADLALEATK